MQNEAISCPICQHPGNGAFCGMCGSRMVEEAATVAWCLKCGFKHASAAFCPQCGNPMANGQIGNSWSLAAGYPSGDTQALEQTEMLAPQVQVFDAFHYYGNNSFQKHAEAAFAEKSQKNHQYNLSWISCAVLFSIITVGAIVILLFGHFYNGWVYVLWVASLYGFFIFRGKAKGKDYSVWDMVIIITSAVLITVFLYITLNDTSYYFVQITSGYSYETYRTFIWHGTRSVPHRPIIT